MDRKLQYDFEYQLEAPSFSKIHTKVMRLWCETEEGTEMFVKLKDIIDTIEIERNKLEEIKSLAFMVANKL
jgi:hypothetical protein